MTYHGNHDRTFLLTLSLSLPPLGLPSPSGWKDRGQVLREAHAMVWLILPPPTSPPPPPDSPRSELHHNYSRATEGRGSTGLGIFWLSLESLMSVIPKAETIPRSDAHISSEHGNSLTAASESQRPRSRSIIPAVTSFKKSLLLSYFKEVQNVL